MPGQCPDCGRRNCDECQELDDFLAEKQVDEAEEEFLDYDYWREQEDNQDADSYQDWYDVEYAAYDEQDFGDDGQLVDLTPEQEEDLPF